MPHEVGVSCCAQFALTRDKIREIPRTEYVRLREWLAKTPLLDSISGRVMEYSWHSKFGQVFLLFLRKNASMPDCWHSCCPTRSGLDAFVIAIRNGCWWLAASMGRCCIVLSRTPLRTNFLCSFFRICGRAAAMDALQMGRLRRLFVAMQGFTNTYTYSFVRQGAHSLPVSARLLLQSLRAMRFKMSGNRNVRRALRSPALFLAAEWLAVRWLGFRAPRENSGTRCSQLSQFILKNEKCYVLQ